MKRVYLQRFINRRVFRTVNARIKASFMDVCVTWFTTVYFEDVFLIEQTCLGNTSFSAAFVIHDDSLSKGEQGIQLQHPVINICN